MLKNIYFYFLIYIFIINKLYYEYIVFNSEIFWFRNLIQFNLTSKKKLMLLSVKFSNVNLLNITDFFFTLPWTANTEQIISAITGLFYCSKISNSIFEIFTVQRRNLYLPAFLCIIDKPLLYVILFFFLFPSNFI